MLGVSQGSGFTSRDGCTTKIALQTAQGSPHHPFIALCHYSSYQTHDKAAWCADTHYQEPVGEWQDGGGQRVPQFQQSPGRSRGWWGHHYVPPTHTAAAQPSSPCRPEQPIGPPSLCLPPITGRCSQSPACPSSRRSPRALHFCPPRRNPGRKEAGASLRTCR